jgi:hypothetical protein
MAAGRSFKNLESMDDARKACNEYMEENYQKVEDCLEDL